MSSDPTKQGGFYPFIHVLRGIAPLLVLWSHLYGFYIWDHKINDWPGSKVWFEYFATPLHLYQNAGHLGVILFFYVSGFVMTHASMREGYTEFLIKRVLRIFPVLAVSLVIGYIAHNVAARMGLGTLTGLPLAEAAAYVRSFFLADMLMGAAQTTPVTWTLVVEVMYYLLTFALLGATRRSPENATYFMIGLWTAAEMLFTGTAQLGHLRYFSDFVGLLIIGRLVYLADTGIIGWRKAMPMMLGVSVLFVCFYTLTKPGVLMTAGYEPAVTYLLGFAIFTGAMTHGAKTVPRWLAFFADISLSLYLLHIPVGMFVITFAQSLGVGYTWALIIGTGAVIGASALSYRFVEKPCQALARRLAYQPSMPFEKFKGVAK